MRCGSVVGGGEDAIGSAGGGEDAIGSAGEDVPSEDGKIAVPKAGE